MVILIVGGERDPGLHPRAERPRGDRAAAQPDPALGPGDSRRDAARGAGERGGAGRPGAPLRGGDRPRRRAPARDERSLRRGGGPHGRELRGREARGRGARGRRARRAHEHASSAAPTCRAAPARALVTSTGKTTELGRIAARLGQAVPETEFDRGLRHYGYVLLATMFVIVVGVFTVQVLLDRPPIETLLFALALAVGLSPELLPAILSVNLAAGAQAMASRGVLVRRLNAIENLGSMDVLCTDKTGTLTEGTVRLVAALGLDGAPSGPGARPRGEERRAPRGNGEPARRGDPARGAEPAGPGREAGGDPLRLRPQAALGRRRRRARSGADLEGRGGPAARGLHGRRGRRGVRSRRAARAGRPVGEGRAARARGGGPLARRTAAVRRRRRGRAHPGRASCSSAMRRSRAWGRRSPSSARSGWRSS